MTAKRLLGVVCIGAGLVLCIFFRDSRYEWFDGGWLGMALVALGIWDLVDEACRVRGRQPVGLMEELRREVGIAVKLSATRKKSD